MWKFKQWLEKWMKQPFILISFPGPNIMKSHNHSHLILMAMKTRFLLLRQV